MTDSEQQIPHPLAQPQDAAAASEQASSNPADAATTEPASQAAQPGQEATATEPTPPIDWETRARELEAERERDRIEREQERTQTEQQMQAWTQFQQHQQQQQRQQQIAQLQQEYQDDLKRTYERLINTDDEGEGLKLLGGFMSQYMGKAQQAFQQREQHLEQTYQQRLSQAEIEVREYLAQQMKPGAAKQLVAEYGLPAEAEQILLDLPDPNQMPQMAQLIKQQVSQVSPQVQQQVAQRQAEEHRQNGTFNMGGIAGGPLPQKQFEPMESTSAEAVEAARFILGMT